MAEPKAFAPLMESIEQMLEALEGQTLPPYLESRIVEELQAKYDEYKACCCMIGQVVKSEPAAAE
jgi:hypothetical protein